MLKVFATVSFFFLATTSLSAESLELDGCYQLYVPNAMYPALCLAGTAEEGIDGAGVRLVMFNTNSDTVAACMKSSQSSWTSNSFTFIVNGKKELIFKNIKVEDGVMLGDAVFGRTSLKFVQIDAANTRRMIQKMYAECSF